ncbi:MAG: RAD55 family ATPase [Candidatus Hadarchaeaceae archaeon]
MLRDTVKGLDKVMKNDIPQGYVVLVTGGVGSMKSSFVFSILSSYLSKQEDEFGVYVTLEESRESHMRNMESLRIKRPKNLQIFDYQDIRKEWREEEPTLNMMSITEDVIKFYKEEMKNKFTVFCLDSLNALQTLAKSDNLRRESYHFFNLLRDSGLASFIIQESQIIGEGRRHIPESYLADGVIELGVIETPELITRYIQVRKMRACRHSMKKHQLIVNEGGLEVLGPIYE